jgi:hypothetical protein
MIAVAALLIALASPGITAAIAPDQPLPHVYIGDPVILELQSDTDLTARARVTVEGDDGSETVLDLGDVTLRAHAAMWKPLDGIPQERNRYTAIIRLEAPGTALEKTFVFCRIDRPSAGVDRPLGLLLDNVSQRRLDAAAAVGVSRVRLPASAPGLVQHIQTALDNQFEVDILIDTADPDEARELAAQLARTHGGHISRWDLPAADPDVFFALAEALRGAGAGGTITLAVKTPSEVARFSGAPAGIVNGILITLAEGQAPDVSAFRGAAEGIGIERPSLYLSGQGADPDGPHPGATLVQELVRHKASGIVETDIDSGTLMHEGIFATGYPLVSALIRQLDGTEYLGAPELAAPAEAHVFRIRNGWRCVVWSNQGEADAVLPVGDAASLALTDSRNNPLPTPVTDEGVLTLGIGPRPLYLSGEGGTMLLVAATRGFREEAAAFSTSPRFKERLPGDLMENAAAAAKGHGKISRPDLFALMRAFPFLEQEWHRGGMPAAVAVPAMASLARMLDLACLIEQEHGEPFLEPIEDALNRCSQYQSVYLTRSIASPEARARGDWVLAEVGRLVKRAETLARADRPIEASAVATMAEWRARALEYAAMDFAGPLPEEAPAEPDAEPGKKVAPEEPEDDAADTGVEPDEEVVPEPPEEEDAGPVTFRVMRGEGPWQIANKHGVTLDDLLKWNKWNRNKRLDVNEEYIVYGSKLDKGN